MDLFDSDVLTAASVETHESHVKCRVLLERLAKTGGCCSTHSLAETYNTLTKGKRGYGLEPAVALTAIDSVRGSFTLITLTPGEVAKTLGLMAELDIRGPIVYDALIVACARKMDVARIYTMNVGHFRQVGPDLADRMMQP